MSSLRTVRVVAFGTSLGIEMQGPPRIQSFLMIHFGSEPA